MAEYFDEENSIDLSYSDLDSFPSFLNSRALNLISLKLDHNNITILTRQIGLYESLVTLDISDNSMTYLSDELSRLVNLRSLVAKNNKLDEDSLPKNFGSMKSLQLVNFAGNRFTDLPTQFTELENLNRLFMGANRLKTLPESINQLKNLEVLYVGGNRLQSIPETIGDLKYLTAMILSDNQLTNLPDSILKLRRLQSLSLHNNQLQTLPPQIVGLQLTELSLRNNPLVVRFVEDLVWEPPSLKELAGRVVKRHRLTYTEYDLPRCLIEYLASAHQCVNPKCRGVYFTSRVEHVKFVDFCGKFRLPLMQYLCSPACTAESPRVRKSSETDSDEETPVSRMKKVLLG